MEGNTTSNAGVKRITRRKGACGNCRTRKVRCDGAATCGQCTKSGLRCSYDNRPSLSSGSKTPSMSAGGLSGATTPTLSGPRSPLYGFGRRHVAQSQQLRRGYEEADISVGGEDYFGVDFLPSEPLSLQTSRHDSLFNLDDLALPTTLGDQFHDDALAAAFDIGLGSTVSLDALSKSDGGSLFMQPTTQDWEKTWAEELCSDFSTLAPLRFLGRYTDSSNQAQAIDLTKRVWSKARLIPRTEELEVTALAEDGLSPYSHQDTTRFIDAFFNGCYGYFAFVSRPAIEAILTDVVISPSTVDRSAYALLNATIAIGCRELVHKNDPFDNTLQAIPLPRPASYFGRALRCRDVLMNGQPTMLKLQALTAMAVYMRNNRNTSLTRSLLSQAIHMIQELMLSTPATPSATTPGTLQSEMERLFWLLYSIEKPFTLRFGGHSMIDDDLIVYPSPARRCNSGTVSLTGYSGWDIILYRYARLCSVIIKTLYTQSSTKTVANIATGIAHLSEMLEAWRLSIPTPYRPQSFSSMTNLLDQTLNLQQLDSHHKRAWDTCIQNDLFWRHAEVAFAIHRWAVIVPESKVGADLRDLHSQSMEACMEGARRVLDSTSRIRVLPQIDWHHLHIPLLATSLLSISITKLTHSPSALPYLPYLGMSCGYFGRLSTDVEFSRYASSATADIFPEIAELFTLARRSVGLGGDSESSSTSTRSRSRATTVATLPSAAASETSPTSGLGSRAMSAELTRDGEDRDAMSENQGNLMDVDDDSTANTNPAGGSSVVEELDFGDLDNHLEWFEFPVDGKEGLSSGISGWNQGTLQEDVIWLDS